MANLNAQAEDGTYPILGTNTALPVYWVDVLANPRNATPSANNTIIGRYAFWTDDENSKVNINTADGVMNTTSLPQAARHLYGGRDADRSQLDGD